MSRPSSDYTKCPSCNRRTVLFRFSTDGDVLRCTRADCRWDTFRFPEPHDSTYGPETEKWKVLNGVTDTGHES